MYPPSYPCAILCLMGSKFRFNPSMCPHGGNLQAQYVKRFRNPHMETHGHAFSILYWYRTQKYTIIFRPHFHQSPPQLTTAREWHRSSRPVNPPRAANNCRKLWSLPKDIFRPPSLKTYAWYRKLEFKFKLPSGHNFLLQHALTTMRRLSPEFSAGALLRNQIAAGICPTLQSIWTLVYLGPPGHFWDDQGSAYLYQ